MHFSENKYCLLFVDASAEQNTHAQIVFTVSKDLFNTLPDTIINKIGSSEHYFGESVDFHLPYPDLFGNAEFGYRKCAYVTHLNEESLIHIDIRHEYRHEIARTIHVLSRILYNNEVSCPLIIDTYTERCQWGHPLTGTISKNIFEWLRFKALESKHGLETSVPEDVIHTMEYVWKTLGSTDEHGFGMNCSGWICPDGRFILTCPGNACDIAIYPDMDYGNHLDRIGFNCHNLDTATQQITLLAGLIKLCQIAELDKETMM